MPFDHSYGQDQPVATKVPARRPVYSEVASRVTLSGCSCLRLMFSFHFCNAAAFDCSNEIVEAYSSSSRCGVVHYD